MLPEFSAGRIIHPPGTATNSSALALVADRLHAYPFIPTAPLTIDALSVVVATVASGGPATMEVGVYLDTGNGPGALLAKATITGLGTSGVKTVPVTPFTVAPNAVVWFVYRCPAHTTMPVLRGANFLPLADTSAGNLGPVPSPDIYAMNGVAALPATLDPVRDTEWTFLAGIPASVGLRIMDPAPASVRTLVVVPTAPASGAVGLARPSSARFGQLPTTNAI